ncbi:MAG: alanine racemase [Alphaproteobacteria bacterium]|nr:alanine racemase [Alphaproteobacteria bacterium]
MVKRLEELETPRLLLDADRLARNCAAMRERCRQLGVQLRPHLKTAKSLEVARVALAGEASAITVSTLHEAEYFARNGYRDILCASGIVPGKLAHAARIQRDTGCDLILVTDALAVVEAAAQFAQANKVALSFLIEIDCGEHRSGQLPDAPELTAIARAIEAAPQLRLRGVMAHAGHSYGADAPSGVVAIAAAERDAAVGAAARIRAAGMPCEIVSIGSTPTVLMADHLEGVTEARAGIYMFWDLAQLSRKVCREEDLAVSVLTSVIGHTRHANTLILDAGALALSKDVGANRLLPDAGYGYLCDPHSMQRLGPLAVNTVHQEHGTVLVEDPRWFDRLPVGSLVRVLPNHACITCAAYPSYEVLRGGEVVERWARVNGW